MQEVVIGGFTDGQGDRASTFGALLLGIPVEGAPATLDYVGKVGTGFDRAARGDLLAMLTKATRSTSPFAGRLPAAVERSAHWVRPVRVGEVRFSEWTASGHLRHPVWRGLRTDKAVRDVRRES